MSEHCKNYAVELLDLCRSTEEILAMVNENAGEEIEVYDGSDARANSLARVKLALKYEQKRVRTRVRVLRLKGPSLSLTVYPWNNTMEVHVRLSTET